MALPIVAIVGRPNVGKSTLVNRIAQTGDAIVHEMRGVTRDRSYHKADWNGVEFMLIDTGGIEMGGDDAFQGSIRAQAFEGAREADVIIFLVDGKAGINTDDEEVARILQKAGKPVFVAVNKMDNPARMDEVWEFYALGLGDPWPVSAQHGNGTGDLLDEVVNELRKVEVVPEEEVEAINVAIIGRPNAGKSSLTNKLTNNNRSIVSDVAGTTRDAIDTLVEHEGQMYRIVDTAGLRRKSQIDEDVEYYGFVRAMRAIDRADVALLVIDGTLGLTNDGPARGRVCRRARVRHGDRAEQVGYRGGPRGEGEDPRAHRGPHDVRGLRAGGGHLCAHRQARRPHLECHRRRVCQLQPHHPHGPFEHLARRYPRDGAHRVEGQSGVTHEVPHPDRHLPAALHLLRESPRCRGRQLRALP